MTLDDLKKIFMSPTLFRLDTIWSTRLVPLLYGTGLSVILLLSVSHLFWTFGFGFSAGLWGVLEVLVFGLFYILVLRIACEAILVFYKAHASATAVVTQSRVPLTLLDEVREAIHDLAEDEDDGNDPSALASVPSSMDADMPPRGPVVKRTARRTPPAKL